MDPNLDPLHAIFSLDLCLEIAMFLPIELMKACVTENTGSNERLTSEYQRRTNMVNATQALLPFMDEARNESIAIAAWRIYSPFNGLAFSNPYSHAVRQWMSDFGIGSAPKDLQNHHITVALLRSHLQMIDCQRNPNSVIVLYDKILKLMKPDEAISKSFYRLKKEAVKTFNLTVSTYFADADDGSDRLRVNLYCMQANQGFKQLFEFKADVAEVFKLMGYRLDRINRVSYVHLLYLRNLLIKCNARGVCG